MVGKIDHFFYKKLHAEKNGPSNTDSSHLLVDYWETKLLWQNYVIFHVLFIYTKHINQTSEVQTISVLMNKLKEVNKYQDERKLNFFLTTCSIGKVVRSSVRQSWSYIF